MVPEFLRSAALILALLSLTSGTASPQAFSTGTPAVPTAGISAAPSGPPAHESLDFSVEWRLITAGKANLSWNSTPGAGIGAGDVKLHLESAGLVSRLFLVDDNYAASLRANFCAQSSSIEAREGTRHKDTQVTYDSGARRASFLEKDLVKNTSTTQEVEIPPCVHDLIGGLMALRYMQIEPGKSAQIPVSDGKKFVMAKVESQRHEQLKTAFGPVNTTLYEIYLFDNVLFRRSGRLHIWISDDERRLPVQLQVRLQFAIGTITFRLNKPTEATLGGK